MAYSLGDSTGPSNPSGSVTVYVVSRVSGETLDINVRDNGGQTPFMVAVTLGHFEAVRLLHKHGRYVNQSVSQSSHPINHSIKTISIDQSSHPSNQSIN